MKSLRIDRAFQQGDIEQVIQIVNAGFASIPNQLWQKENETFYHALIHLTFSLVSVFVQSEINSANGRLDARVETDDCIYILEFKLDQKADKALKQIEERAYFLAYQDSAKQKIGIGINFSSAEKKVAKWGMKAF